MKVLIIGNSGIEHALALNLSLSTHVNKIYCCPANPGISNIAECISIDLNDFQSLVAFSKEKNIDLVLVNSPQLISQGIVDFFKSHKIKIFAPNKDSSQIEWSKYFTKEFALRREIPAPRYVAFDKKEYALAYVSSRKLPVVIKANTCFDESKGSVVVSSFEGAEGAINACLQGHFGANNRTVIIEEYIEGEVLSIFAICDGENYSILPTVKSYRNLFNEEKGPLTEGMGAISPHPNLPSHILEKIELQILKPFIEGMKEEGRPYKGFLAIKTVIDKNSQPYLLELNSTLKDPEAQLIFLLLECDLFEVLWQAQRGTLGYFRGVLPSVETSGNPGIALNAVISIQGYPDKFNDDLAIRFQKNLIFGNHCQLIDQSGEINHNLVKIFLFHMGTKLDFSKNLITAGGRVFGITALSNDINLAKKALYKVISKIDIKGKHFREDIGL